MAEKYVCGIPLDLDSIQSSADEDVPGKSGDKIHISAYLPFRLDIHSTTNEHALCDITTIFPVAPSMREVKIHVENKDKDGKQHPDFRPASELVHAGLDWFEKRLGGRFNAICYEWGNWSDNFATYVKRRDEELANGVPLHNAKILAALTTWTAQKIALPRGYKKVTVNEVLYSYTKDLKQVVGKFSF